MKQIIFDLDDTLYVSQELRQKREYAIMEFLGDKLDDYLKLRKTHSTIQSLNLLGVSTPDFYKIIKSVEINLEEDKKLKRILSKLKKHFELVVLSNSPRFCVHISLKKLGIHSHFNKIYSGDDFLESKPHISCFCMVKKGDICVGNNFKKDLKVPNEKGATTILVSDKTHEEADFIISSIYGINKLFDKL